MSLMWLYPTVRGCSGLIEVGRSEPQGRLMLSEEISHVDTVQVCCVGAISKNAC